MQCIKCLRQILIFLTFDFIKNLYKLIIFLISWHFSRLIHVTVDDVNEYIPLWSEQEYSGQLEEGELSTFILQVDASDNDCSPKFGDICKYSISGSDKTFSIDQQGIITNTEPLWTRKLVIFGFWGCWIKSIINKQIFEQSGSKG